MVSRYEYGLSNKKSTYHEPAVNAESFDDFLFSDKMRKAMRTQKIENNAYDKKGEFLFDDVVRVESIKKDLKAIAKKIGLVDLDIPHKNKNRRTCKKSNYYTEKSASLVRKEYNYEIEKFEYEFPQEYAL